jgi:spore germination protein KA
MHFFSKYFKALQELIVYKPSKTSPTFVLREKEGPGNTTAQEPMKIASREHDALLRYARSIATTLEKAKSVLVEPAPNEKLASLRTEINALNEQKAHLSPHIAAYSHAQNPLDQSVISESLDENLSYFKELFKNDNTIIYRHFENQYSNIKYCIIFVGGMENTEIVNENILKPIIKSTILKETPSTTNVLINKVIFSGNVNVTSNIDKIIETVLSGDVVLLTEKSPEAVLIHARGWKSRSIEEPPAEIVLRGPREGFTEAIMENISLVRRKLKTSDLKFNFRTIGKRSNTQICVCYLDGFVNQKILVELSNRLDDINIDGILDSGYIQEMIKDSPLSLFDTIGSTERPDVVAGRLLEGRIAIFTDGSPVILTVPHIFIELFQSSDDYYVNFYYASIGRMLRILSFILTISIPAVYISLVTFHQEMMPTPLLISISAAREGVPLPTVIEAVGMLFVFEILREAGLRMPSFMGQSLSIVGALVLGQAAVEAKFISAPMVIIIAFTGITGIMITKLKGAIILTRLILLLFSSIIGLYGYMFGIAIILIDLMGMRSFGVPYMYKLLLLDPLEDIKDTAIRAPWWYQKYRPKLISANIIRNKSR